MRSIGKASLALTAVLLFCQPVMSGVNTAGQLGVGIDGGLLIPASGNVLLDTSISDVFKAGPSFGVHVRCGIAKEFSVELGGKYSFSKMKDELLPGDGSEPYFTSFQMYLDGILNLGAFINSENNVVNPFLRAGVGLYPWKITQDGAGGDVVVLENGEEFKKTSFGLNFGAGVEFFAISQLSIFAEGKYHVVFSKDEAKFGPDFENVGFVGVTAGLTYHFPLGSR